MARKTRTRRNRTEVVSIRFENDLSQFYRVRANEAGLSLAEFIRQTLMRGITADSVKEVQSQLESISDRIGSPAPSLARHGIPDEVLKSVFLSEALLATIVESRSPDDFYAAQETANKRLRVFKGS